MAFLAGIIAAFCLAGCDFGGSGTGTPGWPSNTMLNNVGIANMPKPAGATDITHSYSAIAGKYYLSIKFAGSNANDMEIDTWLKTTGGFADKGTGLSILATSAAGSYEKEAAPFTYTVIYSRTKTTECSLNVTRTGN